MSHSHRDDHQLTDREAVDPEPVIPVAPVPQLTNSEAERRAHEKRSADGTGEQVIDHQFTGDIPEPSRGGTDTETRIVFEDTDSTAQDALANQPLTARRGPPAPRAQQFTDDGSWAAPALLDAMVPSADSAAPTRWHITSNATAAALPGRSGPSWATGFGQHCSSDAVVDLRARG